MPDSNHNDWSDVLSAGLLAAATVASAWCAYQAALWSGDQVRGLAEASGAHFESMRKDNAANVQLMIDVSTFLRFIDSEARGEEKAAAYIRAHARPEFRPSLEAWLDSRRAGREPVGLPFDLPSYRLSSRESADRSRNQANAESDAANRANDHSDLFVLHTVLFATALFFLGSSTSAHRRNVRRAMLAIGALILTLSVISMIRLPRAPNAPGSGSASIERKA